MFNEICINEEMLPKYTYIYIYIYIYISSVDFSRHEFFKSEANGRIPIAYWVRYCTATSQ